MRVLYVSAFFIATCGLVYELVGATLASYLVGDSVTWFSLVIGVYLSAMGVGAWLSRHVGDDLVGRFIEVEVIVALLGGFSAPLLFAAFTWTPYFELTVYLVVFGVGTFVGLELPLLMRILQRETTLEDLVSRVLFLDYIGALVASLAFPMLLLPGLGLMRTSLVFGLLNALVGLATTWVFPAPAARLLGLRLLTGGAAALLLGGLFGAAELERTMEQQLYANPVVYAVRSPYQRIVVTQQPRDTRLYLNGALQFASIDEHRYHEALVHPAMVSTQPRHVLVLGGGDGLAVREVLRHPEVETVTLVDLDPEMTTGFRDRPELAALNQGSLSDPRVEIINSDAFTWLRERPRPASSADTTLTERAEPAFNAVIIDFPDPNHHALGKLYTTHFYRMLAQHLAPGAAMVVQATSPMYATDAFWCIHNTLASEGFVTRPYHAYIPSFGEWGFVLASVEPLPEFRPLPPGLRFLNPATLPTLFVFPEDMGPRETPINRLDNQALVALYLEGWESWQSP